MLIRVLTELQNIRYLRRNSRLFAGITFWQIHIIRLWGRLKRGQSAVLGGHVVGVRHVWGGRKDKLADGVAKAVVSVKKVSCGTEKGFTSAREDGARGSQ